MPRIADASDDRLFLPSLQVPDTGHGMQGQRLAELERLFSAAQEEIALLTCERDELLSAVKKWAKADRLERQELLFEATTQELRSELKQMRGALKRLKRENADLSERLNQTSMPRQMRA